eukprot:scaffold53574_cov46-Phaeocystis_antarctica.AAC.2
MVRVGVGGPSADGAVAGENARGGAACWRSWMCGEKKSPIVSPRSETSTLVRGLPSLARSASSSKSPSRSYNWTTLEQHRNNNKSNNKSNKSNNKSRRLVSVFVTLPWEGGCSFAMGRSSLRPSPPPAHSASPGGYGAKRRSARRVVLQAASTTAGEHVR